MSWCRFSTICDNNRSSDLYIFESDYGIEVHVAHSRLLNEELAPQVPAFWDTTADEWLRANEARRAWESENCQRVNIDLEHAGETFIFELKDHLTLFLDKLRYLGYNFPVYVYDYLEDECK